MKKVPDLDKMSGADIAHLAYRDVYEWVKTGKWLRPQFDRWVEELMVQSYGEGFAEANPEEDDVDTDYKH